MASGGRSTQHERKRAAIFIGPEFGTVQRADLVAAAREAGDAGFDVLIACAFNYEAHATEFSKLGRIPVLKARMNADLHMAEDLKNTGKGNLFVIFGEPDIEVAVACGWWLEMAGWWPTMSTLKSYRDLEVWKKSIDLVEQIYRASKAFRQTSGSD